MKKVVMIVGLAAMLAGCSSHAQKRNTAVGALVGAGAGAVAGSFYANPAVGAAVGAAVGGAAGYILTPSEIYFIK